MGNMCLKRAEGALCIEFFVKKLRHAKFCQIPIRVRYLYKFKEVAFCNVCLNLFTTSLVFRFVP